MESITLPLTPAEAALVSTAIVHNLRVCGPTGRDGALLKGVLDRLCGAIAAHEREERLAAVPEKVVDTTHKGAGL